MAAITPIKYAETSTGGVRNPMRDFVSNLPNIYNQYLTILDRNRQRELQKAQFDEGIRQFDEKQALEQEKLTALQKANEFAEGEPARRINEKLIDFYLKNFGSPSGFLGGSSSSSSSGSSGGNKRDAGLDARIQKEIDYYYSLAKDIDSLSSSIAKLKNTSNDSEFNEWFAEMPKDRQDTLSIISALSGRKPGEKIDYAKLADSLSVQLDKKHSQAQSVYENMVNYIDNTNKALGGPVYNKPVNLFPERDPKVIKAEYEKNLLEWEKLNARNEEERKKAELLREQIENLAYSSSNTSSGSSTGKFGVPAKAENKVETDATKIADYLQGLQRTVYDARTLSDRGTNPISLGIGNPGDPYFGSGNLEKLALDSNYTSLGSSQGKFDIPAKAVYDARTLRDRGTNPIILGIGNPGDPYFSSGNNVYEQYLKALNAGKNR